MGIQEHIDSITNKIKDYRQGEIPEIDQDHVEKWLNQFDRENRLVLAREMDHVLQKYYLTLEDAKGFLRAVLKKKEICGDLVKDFKKVKFLNIQRNGNSQFEVLRLVSDILKEDYNIDIEDTGIEPEKYIYIDDCLFSGNTLFYDIKEWISKTDAEIKDLHMVFFSVYSRGHFNTSMRLKEMFTEEGMKTKYTVWYIKEFKNNNNKFSEYECCWPTNTLNDDDNLLSFIERLNEQCEGKHRGPRLFRDNKIALSETLFTSNEGRNVVESLFLKYGSYITSLPSKLRKSIRPLGYESFESLGFGAMFVTYRNIANNCPLVLWWGDTDMPEDHPFSKWHPLFPRIVNKKEEDFF